MTYVTSISEQRKAMGLSSAQMPKPRNFRLRELRGLGILAAGRQIQRVNESLFLVKSQSAPDRSYEVKWDDPNRGWTCSCMDYMKRGSPCKHVHGVNFLMDLPHIVLSNSDAAERHCPYCDSKRMVRRGLRYNKSGTAQIYWCKDCKRRFPDNVLKGKSGNSCAVGVIAIDLHYKGLSLRNIREHLWQIYGIEKPASTLQFWITKLTKLFAKAVANLELKVGDKWLGDEMIVKIKGKPKYLWNILDFESRQLIVSLAMDGRGAEEALAALQEAIQKTGKTPKEFVSDGLQSYSVALKAIEGGINHVSNAALADKDNNNRIERAHNTLRGWVRIRRGLKDSTRLSEGYKNYYNHIRPHMALENKTPAEMCGIKVEGQNKWLTLIENATLNARKPRNEFEGI